MNKKTRNIVYRENVATQSVNVVTKFFNMGRQDSENGYYYKPHIHEEFEIIYIIDGTLHPKIDGVDLKVKKNELYFVQPGQQHEEFAEDGFVSFYYIKCNFYGMDGKIAYITNDINSQVISNNKSEFNTIYKKMFKEVHSKKMGYWQILESLTLIVFCNILRIVNNKSNNDSLNYLGFDEYKPHYGNPIIDKTIEYMNANENKMLTIEELADSVHISPSYLFSLFKKQLNISPIKYMMSLKIDHAKIMLAQSDLSAKAIANYLGFDDYSHFCKVFKKNTEVTPLEYRNQFIRKE